MVGMELILFPNPTFATAMANVGTTKNTKKTFLVESDKFNLVKFVEHNSICSPIYFRGNLLGCIILADKESRKGFIHFSDLDANLFDSLTKEISLTINNLKLIDDLQSTNNLIDNIMTSIEAGIIKFTEFGEIEYVNKKAIEIIGIESKTKSFISLNICL